jgi:hypothetical protein
MSVPQGANAPRADFSTPALKPVPTTRVALGENVWLETVRSPEETYGMAVRDLLNAVGGSMGIGGQLAGYLPKQPVVTWQLRSAGIKRRVVLDLEVVLRQGYLEHLISRSEAGKDHETIASNSFDAERLHQGLQGIELHPGKPATFVNEKREYDFKPATGDVVKIYFQYEDEKGKTVTVPAQKWVLQAKDGKTLSVDWVYAGSYKAKAKDLNGDDYEFFGANDGRVVCLANFGSALLDLPIESAPADPTGTDLGYKANTDAIPPRGTKVRAIFEPAPKAHK